MVFFPNTQNNNEQEPGVQKRESGEEKFEDVPPKIPFPVS